MARGQTQYYGLNQWEAADQVLRTEFNADNAKIEMVLKNLEKDKASNSLVNGLVGVLHNTNVTLKNLVQRVESLEKK